MTYTHNGHATHVALRDSESAKRARQTDWHVVIRRIERAHGVTLEQMQGPRRYRPIVRARWALIAALRERGWSLMRIGKFLNRDHTTVLYALRREAERRAELTAVVEAAGVL